MDQIEAGYKNISMERQWNIFGEVFPAKLLDTCVCGISLVQGNLEYWGYHPTLNSLILNIPLVKIQTTFLCE